MNSNFMSFDSTTQQLFLQSHYYPLPSSSHVAFPASLKSFSVCIGVGFNPTGDLPALQSVLRHAAERCTSATDVDVLVVSKQWRLTEGLSRQFLEWLRQWNLPQERPLFRLVTSCSSLRTEVIYRGGRVKTSAGVPFDIISNNVLESLSSLPNFKWLELRRPMMSPLHPYNPGRSLNALRQRLSIFRNLQCVTICLLLGDALLPILQMITALPHCQSLEFVDWVAPIVYSQTERQEVVRALQAGLAGFHHLQILKLPSRDLERPLRGVLGTLEDLKEVIFPPVI
ncbi:hypothetical protein V5O48_008838 [Marasmius crinis-equi]|uniref:Uncharacterized protein n=1 Tax=Marasmius crinis-equi TaxID=585013 RepID=A0ABR3FCS5_9AGAR